jgi:putative FmdB family regulatory protein
MPFYEYRAADIDHSCSYCKDGFEVCQSIKSSKIKKCPECKSNIVKMVSRIGGVVVSDRAANEYNDILKAKYWRDHNGVRHKVTAGDGHSGSGTVSKKQIRTPEEVAAIKKRADQQRKLQRTQQSYQKFANQQKVRRK